MDETRGPEPPIFDVAQTLLALADIERCVLAIALDKGRGVDCQLHACQVAHKLLLDRLTAFELRDLQMGQRHLEASIARNHREFD